MALALILGSLALIYKSGVLNFPLLTAPRSTLPEKDRISSVLSGCAKGTKGEVGSYKCALDKLRIVVKSKGIDSGFDFFKNSQAVNSSACHGLAHEFGRMVFNQAVLGNRPPLTDETSFCEYGFWHGFLNAYIERDKKSDTGRIQKICQDMDAKDMSPGRLIGWNCWHGLGLGAVGDPPQISVWGNPQKMAESGFPLCEKIGTDKRQVSACVEGIFHSMITYMMLKQYKLSFSPDDPLALCRIQKKYQRECYAQLAPQTSGFVFTLLIHNPGILSGLSPENRDLYVRSASVARIRSQLAQPGYIDNFISDCHAMPFELQSSCLNAGVLGIFIKGTPDEFKAPLSFCASAKLSDTEKIDCYSAFGQSLKNRYPDLSSQKICSSVENVYMDYCVGRTYRKPH